MTEQHPVIPSTELVEQWINEPGGLSAVHVAIQAARWGFRQCIKVDAAWLEDKLQKARDQELEACVEWLRTNIGTSFSSSVESELRAAMRPRPPSLAEQALEACERSAFGIPGDRDIIRRALELLQELEQLND